MQKIQIFYVLYNINRKFIEFKKFLHAQCLKEVRFFKSNLKFIDNNIYHRIF